MKGLLIFSFFLLFSSESFAKDRVPDIQAGMEAREVLTVAGAPVSKKIMEIKRLEEWIYPGYTILFREGKVIMLNGSEAPTPAAHASVKAQEVQEKGKPAKKTPPDLLRSILKELPSSSGTPGAPAQAAGAVSPLQPVSPGVPPRGLVPMEGEQ